MSTILKSILSSQLDLQDCPNGLSDAGLQIDSKAWVHLNPWHSSDAP
jgi:hypothetical protein